MSRVILLSVSYKVLLKKAYQLLALVIANLHNPVDTGVTTVIHQLY